MMVSAYGTVEERRRDLPLLRISGLKDVLTAFMSVNWRQFHINGNFSYILRPYLKRSLPEAVAKSCQRAFYFVIGAL